MESSKPMLESCSEWHGVAMVMQETHCKVCMGSHTNPSPMPASLPLSDEELYGGECTPHSDPPQPCWDLHRSGGKAPRQVFSPCSLALLDCHHPSWPPQQSPISQPWSYDGAACPPSPSPLHNSHHWIG